VAVEVVVLQEGVEDRVEVLTGPVADPEGDPSGPPEHLVRSHEGAHIQVAVLRREDEASHEVVELHEVAELRVVEQGGREEVLPVGAGAELTSSLTHCV